MRKTTSTASLIHQVSPSILAGGFSFYHAIFLERMLSMLLSCCRCFRCCCSQFLTWVSLSHFLSPSDVLLSFRPHTLFCLTLSTERVSLICLVPVYFPIRFSFTASRPFFTSKMSSLISIGGQLK